MTYRSDFSSYEENGNIDSDDDNLQRFNIGIGRFKELRMEQAAGGVGIQSFGLTGNATVVGTATVLVDSTGQYINYASAATNGSKAGLLPPNYVQIYRNAMPHMNLTFKTGASATDIQNVRMWYGLFSADPTGADSLGTIQGMGFRYSTAADGTAFWRVITSNGTASTITATSLPISANTRYDLRIDATDPSVVKFFSGTQWLVNHTTNLPSVSQGTGMVLEITNLSAAKHNWCFSRVLVSYF